MSQHGSLLLVSLNNREYFPWVVAQWRAAGFSNILQCDLGSRDGTLVLAQSLGVKTVSSWDEPPASHGELSERIVKSLKFARLQSSKTEIALVAFAWEVPHNEGSCPLRTEALSTSRMRAEALRRLGVYGSQWSESNFDILSKDHDSEHDVGYHAFRGTPSGMSLGLEGDSSSNAGADRTLLCAIPILLSRQAQLAAIRRQSLRRLLESPVSVRDGLLGEGLGLMGEAVVGRCAPDSLLPPGSVVAGNRVGLRAAGADRANARPLRVKIFMQSSSGRSGGRLHALLLGLALARNGCAVEIVTDQVQKQVQDLDRAKSTGSVRFTFSRLFWARAEKCDIVFHVPSRPSPPELVFGVMRELAKSPGALLVQLNFETPNWMSEFLEWIPAERWRPDVRVAERLAAGLLSSNRESTRHATSFLAKKEELQFLTWIPPINSDALQSLEEGAEREGVAVVYRNTGPSRHKANSDLVRLISGSDIGAQPVHIITSDELDEAFVSTLEEKARRRGIRLVWHRNVSEVEKFKILGSVKTLLFPSRFEGLGYPPIEALAAGCIPVVRGLPVYEHTLGGLATVFRHEIVGYDAEPLQEAFLRKPLPIFVVAKIREIYGLELAGIDLLSQLLALGEPRRPRNRATLLATAILVSLDYLQLRNKISFSRLIQLSRGATNLKRLRRSIGKEIGSRSLRRFARSLFRP